MSHAICARGTRRGRVSRGVLLPTLVWLICVGVGQAQNSTAIIRIEEDWELVVGQPDADSHAPQVTTVISPLGHLQGFHAAVELNHQSLPDFVPGGLQLQLWDHEDPLESRKAPEEELLNQTGETVRWTQLMRLDDGKLVFEVTNGSSMTWGNFGGQGYLKASLNTDLPSLNAYNPNVSKDNSGIGYAANRVDKLVMKEVRYYSSQGLLHRDTTSRVVHERAAASDD